MLDNWKTPAKTIAENGYHLYLVDQRNHGHSPHDDILSYEAMAEDLYEFMDEQFLSEAIILGHSMGGKTAMKFAQRYPDMVEKLIVVDIAPRRYPVHHHTILEALSAVDLENTGSRKEAEEVLKQYIHEFGVRQFLLKNLYWKERGKLAWRFNLPVIKENIVGMGEEVMDRIFEGSTLFIRGDKSDYVTDEYIPEIEAGFPDSKLVTIANAGHWVHAEQPQPFLQAVLDFL